MIYLSKLKIGFFSGVGESIIIMETLSSAFTLFGTK